jgi:hypothetical protein
MNMMPTRLTAHAAANLALQKCRKASVKTTRYNGKYGLKGCVIELKPTATTSTGNYHEFFVDGVLSCDRVSISKFVKIANKRNWNRLSYRVCWEGICFDLNIWEVEQ